MKRNLKVRIITAITAIALLAGAIPFYENNMPVYAEEIQNEIQVSKETVTDITEQPEMNNIVILDSDSSSGIKDEKKQSVSDSILHFDIKDDDTEHGVSDNDIMSGNTISPNENADAVPSEPSVSDNTMLPDTDDITVLPIPGASDNEAETPSVSNNEAETPSVSDNEITTEPTIEDEIISQDQQQSGEEEQKNVTYDIDASEEFRIEGFKQDSSEIIYSGNKITQEIAIYHKDKLLKENIDYTLFYKNNTDAAAYNSINAPSVTISMKGQYTGKRTLYFTINPRNINEKGNAGYEQAVVYEKQITIPTPVIYYGEYKLQSGKDFVCDYSNLPEDYQQGDAYEIGRTYIYEVRGKGNFTGTFSMNLTIVNDDSRNLAKADVKLAKYTYPYSGDSMQSEDIQIEYVRLQKKNVDSKYYQCTVRTEGVGTGYVIIEPTEEGINVGYRGRKEIKIKLVADRHMKDVRAGENWQPEITFSQTRVKKEGGIYQETDNILVFESENGMDILVEGRDYTVKYKDADRTGKADVLFYGMGRYTGILRKTYRIVPNNELNVHWLEVNEEGQPVARYQKDGSIPKFQVVDADGNVLKNRIDYTFKTKNNHELGMMSLEITGRGNYKGYEFRTELEIIPADISQATMIVHDRKYSEESDGWKSPVQIKDSNGRPLAAGKDYEAELVYSYIDMEQTPVPAVGTIISVTATGKNNYAGSQMTGTYRICKWDLKDLIITIDSKEYTGEEIRLKESDIHVYASKADKKAGKEITEACYEIVEYQKNKNVGRAKVTLKGIGEYGGTITCTFTIYKKIFFTAKVKSFEIEESVIVLGKGQSRKLTVNISPQNANNKTVIWEMDREDVISIDYEGKITAKKVGEVIITATCQDNGMTDTCTVKVCDDVPKAPFLTPQEFKKETDADDTSSFNRAIKALKDYGYDTVYVPAGVYDIDAWSCIRLESNMNLVMSPDAVLQAIPNSRHVYHIIYASYVSNTTITGGQIIGERYHHGDLAGEWGMGIGLYDSKDVTISNVKISDCWGDGIYIGSNDDYNLSLGCERIAVTNCILDNNRRNNLSIVNGEHITVDGCIFRNANGTAPEYGIDIETNNSAKPCEHIVIKNSEFYGNRSASLGIVTVADDVLISGCTLRDDLINYAGTNVEVSGSKLYGEVCARIGLSITDGTILNDDSEREDTLVASFNAAQDNFEIGTYQMDDNNTMLCSYMDSNSPSGRVLRMERTSTGNKESGYTIELSDLMKGSGVKLEAGCNYRFEYVVKGSGQWGIKTDQTPWYPCAPQSDRFATGMVSYKAKDEGGPYRLIFFAEEKTKGMFLEVDSVKIYKVN